MPGPRQDAAAVPLSDGSLLVIGGRQITGSGDMAGLSSVIRYLPGAGTWAAAAPMASPRLFFGAVKLKSGKVLVATGGQGYAPPYMASCEL